MLGYRKKGELILSLEIRGADRDFFPYSTLCQRWAGEIIAHCLSIGNAQFGCADKSCRAFESADPAVEDVRGYIYALPVTGLLPCAAAC